MYMYSDQFIIMKDIDAESLIIIFGRTICIFMALYANVHLTYMSYMFYFVVAVVNQWWSNLTNTFHEWLN